MTTTGASVLERLRLSREVISRMEMALRDNQAAPAVQAQMSSEHRPVEISRLQQWLSWPSESAEQPPVLPETPVLVAAFRGAWRQVSNRVQPRKGLVMYIDVRTQIFGPSHPGPIGGFTLTDPI